MGPVKDVAGNELKSGDKVVVIEDIVYVEEQFKIKNKIPKGATFKITGFPADDRYIQVNYGNSEWAITAQRVKKIN